MPDTLVFDVDGTLADTENNGHRPAFNAAFKALGLEDHWSESQYCDLLRVAGGRERLRHYWQSLGRPEADDRQLVERLHRCKTQYYLRRVHGGEVALRPGVQALLSTARDRGMRFAIATTTTRANVEALLQAQLDPQAKDWFEVIACADDAANKKPAPDVYRFVLQALGVPSHTVIAFEDNRNGLLAARAAGIDRVVITPTVYSRGEDFGEAWQVLEDLTRFELPD